MCIGNMGFFFLKKKIPVNVCAFVYFLDQKLHSIYKCPMYMYEYV